MVQACELIAEFIAGKRLENLFTDRLLASGVERQLEIIGEAASHVSVETQIEWPAINWKGMKGTRDFIAHKYFRANYERIWGAVHYIIPGELPALKELLADLKERFGTPEDAAGV